MVMYRRRPKVGDFVRVQLNIADFCGTVLQIKGKSLVVRDEEFGGGYYRVPLSAVTAFLE